MRVEFLSIYGPILHTGIGRYTFEMARRLSEHCNVSIHQTRHLPFSRRLQGLRSLPVGIEGHKKGGILHFSQIMGSAMMLWRPVHPAVASVHDLGVLVCKEDEVLFNRVGRSILDLQLAGLRRMDHFVVHSDFTRDSLIKHLDIRKDRITVVPTWIDVNHFRPIPNSRQFIRERFGLDLDDGVPSLVYVGSELPRKNLGLLLRAIAVLKARNRRVRLLKIGGAGGEQWRANFKHDIEVLGLHQDVILMGVVSEEDLPVLINAADLCVTTTLLESTFAWIALSAMACGRPSIVTTTALVPDEVQDAVIVVSPDNVDGLAFAIEGLVDDPDRRRRMGEAGLRNIMAYQGDSMVESMLQVYARFG